MKWGRYQVADLVGKRAHWAEAQNHAKFKGFIKFPFVLRYGLAHTT